MSISDNFWLLGTTFGYQVRLLAVAKSLYSDLPVWDGQFDENFDEDTMLYGVVYGFSDHEAVDEINRSRSVRDYCAEWLQVLHLMYLFLFCEYFCRSLDFYRSDTILGFTIHMILNNANYVNLV